MVELARHLCTKHNQPTNLTISTNWQQNKQQSRTSKDTLTVGYRLQLLSTYAIRLALTELPILRRLNSN